MSLFLVLIVNLRLFIPLGSELAKTTDPMVKAFQYIGNFNDENASVYSLQSAPPGFQVERYFHQGKFFGYGNRSVPNYRSDDPFRNKNQNSIAFWGRNNGLVSDVIDTLKSTRVVFLHLKKQISGFSLELSCDLVKMKEVVCFENADFIYYQATLDQPNRFNSFVLEFYMQLLRNLSVSPINSVFYETAILLAAAQGNTKILKEVAPIWSKIEALNMDQLKGYEKDYDSRADFEKIIQAHIAKK